MPESARELGPRTLYLEDPAGMAAALARFQAGLPGGAALLFLSEQDKEALPALQAAAREAEVPLLGAIFPELIVEDRTVRQGALLFWLRAPPPYRFLEAIGADPAPREAAVAALGDLVDEAPPSDGPKSLFFLFDAMVPTISTFLDEVFLSLGDEVRYMGVNAGSETFQPMPCLFDRERVVSDGALAMLLPSDGAVMEHSYRAPEQLVAATSTEGNQVVSIDWRPAFETYQRLARDHFGAEVTQENFYEFGARLPFGVVKLTGDVVVRIPVALNEDGSVFCVGEVPENSVLTVVEAADPESTDTADQLASHFRGYPGDVILTFYCAGRRMHMGPEGAQEELAALTRRVSPIRLAGALSLGEIGAMTQTGYPTFHNATVVCADWSRT